MSDASTRASRRARSWRCISSGESPSGTVVAEMRGRWVSTGGAAAAGGDGAGGAGGAMGGAVRSNCGVTDSRGGCSTRGGGGAAGAGGGGADGALGNLSNSVAAGADGALAGALAAGAAGALAGALAAALGVEEKRSKIGSAGGADCVNGDGVRSSGVGGGSNAGSGARGLGGGCGVGGTSGSSGGVTIGAEGFTEITAPHLRHFTRAPCGGTSESAIV